MEPINFAQGQSPQPQPARRMPGLFSPGTGTMLKAAFLKASTGREAVCEAWQGPMRVEWEDTQ